jgi:hypothetical protein
MSKRPISNPQSAVATNDLSNAALKQVLADVERDEAEAISLLCQALELVEESREFKHLKSIREVVKEWQNQPPRGIVTGLMKVMEKLECRAPAKP